MPGQGRDNGCEKRNGSNMYEHNVGKNMTIAEENANGGWNRKDKPEGGEPAPIETAGSRH